MRIWLDDERPMPEGFTHHVKTAHEAIELLKTGQVEEISLDHDLGDGNGTGYDVAKFIEEQAVTGQTTKFRVRVHSQNVVGRENIKAALRNALRAWMEQNHE